MRQLCNCVFLATAVLKAQKAAEQHAQMADPASGGAGSALSSLISPVFSMQGVRQASLKSWSRAPCDLSGIERKVTTLQRSALTPVICTREVPCSTLQDVCRLHAQVLLLRGAPCRARKQTEFEKRKAAFAKLVGLLMSMMKRRALYDVLPLDPTAWPVLLAAHREELRTTMAEQAALNRVDLSTMDAPGAQVGRHSAAVCLSALQLLHRGKTMQFVAKEPKTLSRRG